jgi:hypothetical protein
MMTLILLPLMLSADPAEAFARGVERRNDQDQAWMHFKESSQGFEQQWRDTGSPEAAQNAARAAYLAGNVPRAVLLVRIALREYPWHEGLRRDLESMRTAILYPRPAEPSEQLRPDPPSELRHFVAPVDLLVLAIVAAGATAAGAWGGWLRRTRVWLMPLGLGLLLFGIVSVVAVLIGQQSRQDATLAVVRDVSILRRGNAASYDPRIAVPLPPGTEVRTIGRRGGWCRVQVAGGATGWLPESKLITAESVQR